MRGKLTALVFVMLAFVSVSFISCSTQKNYSKPCYDGWKISVGDNKQWAKADFNDSSWKVVENVNQIVPGKNEHYFWLRNTLTVPAELAKEESIWLGFGKSNTAIDVYADGVFIGSKCSMPERGTNIRIEQNEEVNIPLSLIHNGKVNIALRVYIPGDHAAGIMPSLDNHYYAYYMTNIKNIFNQRVFLAIGVLCIFILFYALLQYFLDKNNSSFIYFVFCLLFIIFYFFDLGFQNVYINYGFQRAFTRSCLCISMGFMTLFLNRFFNRPKFKLTLAIALGIPGLMLVLFLVNIGNESLINLLFLVSMLPTVASIVYGFVVSISALKRHEHDTVPIIVGFVLGSAFALHDIIFQVLGKTPFMWIQGFAFFSLDLAVFITLSIREDRIRKEVERLASETSTQKENLTTLLSSAKIMATESNDISASLTKSVETMVHASNATQLKVNEINTAIAEQTRIREETDAAVKNLTGFLNEMNKEFEVQTGIISSTAKGTQDVIAGIQTVGDGISTAAQFTSSLSTLTMAGSADMKKLMSVMDTIQASSKEILGVVTTLDDFAQQTDLLSMNASIEAAHSGEAGKGFAVIAHEIKNLASQTQQWSAKIGEIITSVISNIEVSVDLTTKVHKALDEIENGANLSAEKVNAAAEGMKTQQDAGNTISREAGELSVSATHMKDEVMNQSAFSKQVMENMDDLQNASVSVNNASEEISKETNLLSEEAKTLQELAQRTAQSSKQLVELMEKIG